MRPPAVTRWCFGEECSFRKRANPASVAALKGVVGIFLLLGVGRPCCLDASRDGWASREPTGLPLNFLEESSRGIDLCR